MCRTVLASAKQTEPVQTAPLWWCLQRPRRAAEPSMFCSHQPCRASSLPLTRTCYMTRAGAIPSLASDSTVHNRMGLRILLALTHCGLASNSVHPVIIIEMLSLAGVTQWIECQPLKQRVAGLIPSQGTCLSCRPGPQQGVCERQPHIDASFPLFLLPFPSL